MNNRIQNTKLTKILRKSFIPDRVLFYSTLELIHEIEKFFVNGYKKRTNTDSSNFSQKINTPDMFPLKAEILFHTSFCNENSGINERLYCLFNSLSEIPKCESIICNNKVKYYGMNGIFYRRFCSRSCSAKSLKTKSIRAITNLEKYGVENVGESNIIKNKIKSTNIERYGYENTYALVSNPSKISNICFNLLSEQIDSRMCQYNETEKIILKSDGKFYKLDFYYEDGNSKKCIEFYGDYWHRNPRIYEPTDETLDIWGKDCLRINYIESLEIDTLIIWESEFISNQSNIIKKCLMFLKGKNEISNT